MVGKAASVMRETKPLQKVTTVELRLEINVLVRYTYIHGQ